MVEADRPRAGDAPVGASSAQCLAHARCPCVTFEQVGSGHADKWRCPGRASRPADFLRLLPSFARLGFQDGGENGAGDAQPQVRSDRNRSVGTRDRQSSRAAAQRVHRPGTDESAHKLRRRPGHRGRPRSAQQGRAQPRPRRPGRPRARPPPGLPGQTGDELTDRIEEIARHHAIAFLSAKHIDPDMHPDTAAVMPPTTSALLLSPVQADVHQFKCPTLAPDEVREACRAPGSLSHSTLTQQRRSGSRAVSSYLRMTSQTTRQACGRCAAAVVVVVAAAAAVAERMESPCSERVRRPRKRGERAPRRLRSTSAPGHGRRRRAERRRTRRRWSRTRAGRRGAGGTPPARRRG